MTVTRDVILDLLPLYFAGQVTADTKTLVDEFLKTDPDFARMSRRFDTVLTGSREGREEAAAERRTFRRVRRLFRWRNQAIGLAIAFSLTPFAFGFHDGRVDWILLRDRPGVAVSWLFAGVACWIASYAIGRRASAPGKGV